MRCALRKSRVALRPLHAVHHDLAAANRFVVLLVPLELDPRFREQLRELLLSKVAEAGRGRGDVDPREVIAAVVAEVALVMYDGTLRDRMQQKPWKDICQD